MKLEAVIKAQQFAREFDRRAAALREKYEEDSLASLLGSKESSALRRTSMDLTRVLADLRQGREPT